jgi:hypothetical protein
VSADTHEKAGAKLSKRFATQDGAKHKRLILLLLCVACASVAHAQGGPSVVGNYTGTLGTHDLRLRVWHSANGEPGAMGSAVTGRLVRERYNRGLSPHNLLRSTSRLNYRSFHNQRS